MKTFEESKSELIAIIERNIARADKKFNELKELYLDMKKKRDNNDALATVFRDMLTDEQAKTVDKNLAMCNDAIDTLKENGRLCKTFRKINRVFLKELKASTTPAELAEHLKSYEQSIAMLGSLS